MSGIFRKSSRSLLWYSWPMMKNVVAQRKVLQNIEDLQLKTLKTSYHVVLTLKELSFSQTSTIFRGEVTFLCWCLMIYKRLKVCLTSLLCVHSAMDFFLFFIFYLGSFFYIKVITLYSFLTVPYMKTVSRLWNMFPSIMWERLNSTTIFKQQTIFSCLQIIL